jgi:hypothetical protein
MKRLVCGVYKKIVKPISYLDKLCLVCDVTQHICETQTSADKQKNRTKRQTHPNTINTHTHKKKASPKVEIAHVHDVLSCRIVGNDRCAAIGHRIRDLCKCQQIDVAVERVCNA